MEVALLGCTLFALGAFISLLNFYLSFLRYPLYKLLGWEYRWVSGLPLVGSLLLVIAAMFFHDSPRWLGSRLGLALLDTGGLHWFFGAILWHQMLHRRRGPAPRC